MTIKPLKKQLLRTKRHLRSVSTSPRALRDADRGLALAAVGRRGGPGVPLSPRTLRGLSRAPVWRPYRLNLSEITWIPGAAV